MNDLLAFAVEAHGGLDRWNSFSKVQSDLTIDGAIWHVKQVPGLFINKKFEATLREQHLFVEPFAGGTYHYTPKRLEIVDAKGTVLESRDNPERAFEGQVRETPWDKLHAAFFVGEALWTYLNLPFLYAQPGFEVEEIEPWHEDGETWRSLRVKFPKRITSHTEYQITRFGPDGLMRRHDYTVDILGGATGANYSSDYQEFQGIKMPTKRRIFAYDDQMQKVSDPLLVSLDFSNISFL